MNSNNLKTISDKKFTDKVVSNYLVNKNLAKLSLQPKKYQKIQKSKEQNK